MRTRRWGHWLLLALVALSAAAGGGLGAALVAEAAGAGISYFPVEQVPPGVKGIGLTVVSGTRVEPFDVEFLGVLEGAGPAGDLLLVRVSGDVIDRAGGIAAGMSGSPVYLAGRLVGAIGYGFEMTDHRLGLVTPAEPMLALIEAMEAAAGGAAARSGPVPDRVAVVHSEPVPAVRTGPAGAAGDGYQAAPAEGTWTATPLRTPLMIAGLGERAQARLEEAFAGLRVQTFPSGRAGGGPREEINLVPGSAIGVQLARGDVEITAIGTVTAIDDLGRFVAFGHPFLHAGSVDYIATGARVLQTVPGTAMPFKIGAPLGVVGRVAEDRGAGIAGTFGERADTVKVRIRVNDLDRGREEPFTVEVVNHAMLGVALITVAAFEAFDRALDRIGPGTSKVALRVASAGAGRTLERENMYYSEGDIAAESLVELVAALEMLRANPFVEPGVTEVELAATVESRRRTAEIIRAVPRAREVAPGESVDVRVRLRPYRGEPFEVTVPLRIPAASGPGEITVVARGGESVYFDSVDHGSELGPAEVGLEEGAAPAVPYDADSLENLIAEFEQQPRNSDLVLEFYLPENGWEFDEHGPEDEGGGEPHEGWAGEGPADGENGEPAEHEYDPAGSVRSVHPTEYVLHGEASFTLRVVRRDGTERDGHGSDSGEEDDAAAAGGAGEDVDASEEGDAGDERGAGEEDE